MSYKALHDVTPLCLIHFISYFVSYFHIGLHSVPQRHQAHFCLKAPSAWGSSLPDEGSFCVITEGPAPNVTSLERCSLPEEAILYHSSLFPVYSHDLLMT